MFEEAMMFIAGLLILLLIVLLIFPNSQPIIMNSIDCPPASGLDAVQSVMKEMKSQMNPPKSQPVYTMFRQVPKDVVTETEKRYLTEMIQYFSNHKLKLLDVENLDWMAKDDSSPVIGLMDARVNIIGHPDVIRIIIMWCQRTLWSVSLANAKGCFKSKEVSGCAPAVGRIANQVIQMPAYKVMKSIMGRE